QSDDTGGGSVFIQDNSERDRMFLHIHKKVRSLFILICEIRFSENFFQRKAFLITKKKILNISDTHNVVCAVLIYRETGMFFFPEQLDQILISTVNVGKSHIDSGN